METQTRLSAVTQLSLRDGTSVSQRREKRPMAEGQLCHGGDMHLCTLHCLMATICAYGRRQEPRDLDKNRENAPGNTRSTPVNGG